MDSNGRGVLEYLLLIGVIILMAAIVIAILASLGAQGKSQVKNVQDFIENKQQGLTGAVANYP